METPGREPGITANDLGDGDLGANSNPLQNFPLIGTVTPGASTTNIQGTLSSTPSTVFDLDFYAGPPCVAFVRDSLQGRNYLGAGRSRPTAPATSPSGSICPWCCRPARSSARRRRYPLGNTSEVSQGLLFRLDLGYGPPAGTSSALFGMLFENGATVTVGGVAATNVDVVNPGHITYTTPALAPGSANDVVVTNPSGSSGTLKRAYVATFSDAGGNGFEDVISTLVANQVTAGCGTGVYCPDADITRAQMAVFLLKGKYGICYAPPPATGTVFPDVPANAFAAAWIEALADEGITGGCGGGNYCPGNPVTRQQMAVFLMKAEHGASFLPPACTQVFTDVPCSSPFAPWIRRLAAESVTGGCGDGSTYCPLNNATRAQMAAFIVKTFLPPETGAGGKPLFFVAPGNPFRREKEQEGIQCPTALQSPRRFSPSRLSRAPTPIRSRRPPTPAPGRCARRSRRQREPRRRHDRLQHRRLRRSHDRSGHAAVRRSRTP